MQRLKELNQLSKEEAERIQTLRYSRNVITVLADLKHLWGCKFKLIMFYHLLDIGPAKKKDILLIPSVPKLQPLWTLSREIPNKTCRQLKQLSL